MTTANPLLQASELPAFSRIRPEHVLPAIEHRIGAARAAIETLLAALPAEPSFAELMLPLERLDAAIEAAWSPVAHLHAVQDSPALREVYSQADSLLTDYHSEIGQHRGLFEAVQRLRATPAFAALSVAEQTLVDDSLREFRLSGVALEGAARARFRAIANELARLATEFEEAVLDATEAWSRPLAAEDLAGLPDSVRALTRAAAVEHGQTGHLATLKGPVVQALLTHARSRELRQSLYHAYHTRASDQGPQAGQFDNSARIGQILALRHEAAQLLGFANAAELSLADKMAARPQRVLDFLADLGARARPLAERELAELRAFAAEQLALPELQPWDIAYAAEQLRQQRYAFSEEELKPYFPLPAVLAGMLQIAGQVFGVAFRQRAEVAVWHPDVVYYDVLDHDGQLRAGFYLDAYARSGKRGGAWMDVCRSRFDDGGLQHPIAYLTCNGPPPEGERPALLSHDDVLTLFHEFGHGLHHMLTEVTLPGVAGISGVEWDAVELPSQFMENYGWQRATLDLFARHWQTGAALPDALFAKLQASRHFHAGLFLLRQLEYALFDFRLHLDYDPAQPRPPLELLAEIRRQLALIQPPDWQRMPHSFTHIFAGGYAAGYYSYLWAEVLSADAFAAFEEAGVLDAATGARYRREVLAVGGSRPALESFIAFRGREPQPEALLRSYGLAA